MAEAKPQPNRKIVAVIGAGSSGITCAKTLLEHGIDVEVFEKSDRVGGNWVWDNKNGMSAVYWSCYINTSKQLMAYSDFPMPDSFPDYPHHTHIAQYFDDYVDHFGVRDKIRFETGVAGVERAPGDGDRWRVTTEAGESKDYDAVFVANGHHWDPKWPDFPGEFNGTVIHSHDYKTAEDFKGKRVLIVGIGNSGVDISVELSRVCPDVAVSMRRGIRIMPKYMFGIPLDHFGLTPGIVVMPEFVGKGIAYATVRMLQGPVTRFGLPEPEQGLFSTHPTISDEFLPRVGHGAIRTRPNIERLDGDHVVFADGSREPFDAIIYATGYKISFPFLDSSLVPVDDNRVELYKFVVPPRIPNLFFIGLVQPWGAVMPIAEMQSKWLARVLTGASELPTPAAMEKDIERKWRQMRRRYVHTSRHTIQVDHYDYMQELWKEMVPPGLLGKLRKPFRIIDPFTKVVFRRQKEAKERGYASQARVAAGD